MRRAGASRPRWSSTLGSRRVRVRTTKSGPGCARRPGANCCPRAVPMPHSAGSRPSCSTCWRSTAAAPWRSRASSRGTSWCRSRRWHPTAARRAGRRRRGGDVACDAREEVVDGAFRAAAFGDRDIDPARGRRERDRRRPVERFGDRGQRRGREAVSAGVGRSAARRRPARPPVRRRIHLAARSARRPLVDLACRRRGAARHGLDVPARGARRLGVVPGPGARLARWRRRRRRRVRTGERDRSHRRAHARGLRDGVARRARAGRASRRRRRRRVAPRRARRRRRGAGAAPTARKAHGSPRGPTRSGRSSTCSARPAARS